MNLQFETKIEGGNVNIWDYHPYQQMGSDYDIENAAFTVCWDLDIASRSWGIDDMTWRVTEIEGSFDVVNYDINGDEMSRKTVELNFKDFADVTMDTEISNYDSLAPEGIDIDWAAKKIVVT